MTYTTQQNVVDKVRLSIETTAGQLAIQNRDIPRQFIAQINVYTRHLDVIPCMC